MYLFDLITEKHGSKHVNDKQAIMNKIYEQEMTGDHSYK